MKNTHFTPFQGISQGEYEHCINNHAAMYDILQTMVDHFHDRQHIVEVPYQFLGAIYWDLSEALSIGAKGGSAGDVVESFDNLNRTLTNRANHIRANAKKMNLMGVQEELHWINLVQQDLDTVFHSIRDMIEAANAWD